MYNWKIWLNLRQICDECLISLNKVERYGLQKYYHTPFAYQNVSSMWPCAKSKWPGYVTWLTGSSAKARKLQFFPFACLLCCWTLFIATILFGMAKYILKTTQTFGSKIKHWCLMQWRTTVTGVKFRRKSKSVLY